MDITYITGDATSPIGKGNKIIVHVCNDIGGWGKGFVLALSQKWHEPEAEYRKWHKSNQRFELGETQFVQVAQNIWVANMIGQHDIRARGGIPPIRYDAVTRCLEAVAAKAQELDATVHMPRIGCGLAGGKWDQIEYAIAGTLGKNNIKTVVYDFSLDKSQKPHKKSK